MGHAHVDARAIGVSVEVPTLTTERLLLRGWRDEDLDAYAAIHGDPEVMRWLGPEVMDRAQAWRSMAMHMGHWQMRGYGMWAVEERGSGEMVGRVGLWYPEGWPGIEVGWTLARAHWGKGFATEAARASLGHAFGTLGVDRVISLIAPDNERSARVAERIGERFDRVEEVSWGPARIFAIDRPAWQAGARA